MSIVVEHEMAPVSPREKPNGEANALWNNCAVLAIKEFVNDAIPDCVIITVCKHFGFIERGEYAGMTTDAIIRAAKTLGLHLGKEKNLRRNGKSKPISEVLKKHRGTYIAFTGGYEDTFYGGIVDESHVFIIHKGAVIDRTTDNEVLACMPIDSIIEILNP